MAHPEIGHSAFKRWLARSPHEIRLAGPYRDAREAKAVEEAIVSSLEVSCVEQRTTAPSTRRYEVIQRARTDT